MTGAVQPPTCLQIITDAYFDAGLIQEGDECNSQQLANGMRHLNKYVNFLGTQGLSLNFCNPQLLPLVAGQAMYTIGPGGNLAPQYGKPLRIVYADCILAQTGVQYPLLPISWQEYYNLSTSTTLAPSNSPSTLTAGTLSSYMVNKQPTQLQLFIWMTPNKFTALNQVNVYMQFQTPNFNQLNDQMMFPPEWAFTLEWGLAAYLCTGQPQAVITRCTQMAASFQEALLAWDVEDASTLFQPDTRMTMTNRRFTY